MVSFRRSLSAASYLCHAFVSAPCLARPVACFVLGAGVVAVVSSSEVLTTFRVVSSDFHVGIAEGHLDNIAVWLLNENDKLLFSVGGLAFTNAARLVERRSLFFLVGQDAPLLRDNNTQEPIVSQSPNR